MNRWSRLSSLVIVALAVLAIALPATAKVPVGHRPDGISAGAAALELAARAQDPAALQGSPTEGSGLKSFTPGVGFLGYNFDDNSTLNDGYLFIPADPMGAAGPDRVVGVVNTGIECRTKTGTLLFRDSLKNFFSALGSQTLGTYTFDPKIVYDHYEQRFLVVALERWDTAYGDPSNESRILVAVSRTSSPASATAADWYFMAIDAKTNIGGDFHWADYPGFEVDEEAIYVTANMFPFTTGVGGNRLWIINKGVAGGFYAGGAAAWNVYDPIPSGLYELTLMPAQVYGPGGVGGAGSTIGTFLIGYSSLTYGGAGQPEAIEVIRVDDPLGSPTFSGEFVDVGDLEDVGGTFGWPDIPDAPQSGSTALIEVNDSRILDAVWRDNSLWVTTTINPNTANDPVNAGQATAHWIRLDTSAVPGAITVADQGNIGGEDIAPGAATFFPAVAVNGNGEVQFGFSASAPSIFCGAYYAGREPGDPLGTVQAAGEVQAGLDYYKRDFGGTRNRWGDYSGIAVDPADDATFWVYNKYAETRGTPLSGEDGRWGTAWRSAAVSNVINAEVFPLNALSGPVSLYTKPDGTGDPLTAAQLWDGTVGSAPASVDATIVVRLTDGLGNPVVGFPAANITVASQYGGWYQCGSTVLTADAATDVNGETTISGALFGGGSSAPGELLVVNVNSPLLGTTTYPGGLAGLDYRVNSAEMTGDGIVNLSDVAAFSAVYYDPSYDYAGDYRWDGIVNLSDLSVLAGSIGISCPAKAAGQIAEASGELRIVFDSPDGRPARMAAPGQSVDAYVVLRGDAAADGIRAFSARVRTSDNVVIAEREILGEALDLGTGGDMVAGYGGPRSAEGSLALARLRISVTDDQPAYLWLEAGSGAAGPLPAVVQGDRMLSVRPVSGDVTRPVAGLNDKDFEPGDQTPALKGLALANAPNPFNPMTEIRFSLPSDGRVELRVYDAAGRVVSVLVNEVMSAGEHAVVWNGTDSRGRAVSSGVYFATLKTKTGELREKMLLLK